MIWSAAATESPPYSKLRSGRVADAEDDSFDIVVALRLAGAGDVDGPLRPPRKDRGDLGEQLPARCAGEVNVDLVGHGTRRLHAFDPGQLGELQVEFVAALRSVDGALRG